MVGLYLNCHICDNSLKADPCADWAIGERKQLTYRCEKREYKELNQKGGPFHSIIELVYPELEIYSYHLSFIYKEKLYQLKAILDSILPFTKYPTICLNQINFIPFGFQSSKIIELNRRYPINSINNIEDYCHQTFDKLKSLIIFT